MDMIEAPGNSVCRLFEFFFARQNGIRAGELLFRVYQELE
ncbi:hypothetical protein ALQ48_02719 [Pseudomonas coronafaciens pv. zizaniae]|nr:Uncharacterized protein AC511_4077 [Pseudomonas coronafaciens pv. oryzae]RMO09655.1 hypothetical protein ALQ48_02719 [Pseudomonas coronafaciens pv. zizaniae]